MDYGIPGNIEGCRKSYNGSRMYLIGNRLLTKTF